MKPNLLLKREIKNEIEHSRHRSRLGTPPFPLHFHSHLELYVVHAGAVEMTVNDKQKILRDGEIGVAFGYDAHGYRTVADSEVENLIIPREYCKEILHLLEHRQSREAFIRDAVAYGRVSAALTQLSEEQNELSKRGLIYLILGTVLDRLHSSGSVEGSARTEERVPSVAFSPEILIYVSRHFREELTLTALAKQFGYNPSYLSRGFKENFGISFCNYITMLRLREALLLLKSGESSVTKCAMESGFGSMRSFYRVFHEKFGMSPKEYFAKVK